jgi:hypothetical protein
MNHLQIYNLALIIALEDMGYTIEEIIEALCGNGL